MQRSDLRRTLSESPSHRGRYTLTVVRRLAMSSLIAILMAVPVARLVCAAACASRTDAHSCHPQQASETVAITVTHECGHGDGLPATTANRYLLESGALSSSLVTTDLTGPVLDGPVRHLKSLRLIAHSPPGYTTAPLRI